MDTPEKPKKRRIKLAWEPKSDSGPTERPISVDPVFVGIAWVVEHTGLRPHTIHRMARRRQIPAYRGKNRTWRFRSDQIKRWQEAAYNGCRIPAWTAEGYAKETVQEIVTATVTEVFLRIWNRPDSIRRFVEEETAKAHKAMAKYRDEMARDS